MLSRGPFLSLQIQLPEFWTVSGGSALEQAGEQNIDLNNEALDASEANIDVSEGDGGAE